MLAVPDGHTAILFVRSGKLAVGPHGHETTVGTHGVALLDRHGSKLRMAAQTPDASVLILGGEPLDEPIAAHGPFVMSTKDEIREAISDFNAGRMGRL